MRWHYRKDYRKMAITTGTDYLSLLNQISGSGQTSLGGFSGAQAWYSNGMDLWTYYNQIKSDDKDQQAAATQGLIQKCQSWVMSLCANRSGEAEAQAKKNEAKGKQTEQKQQRTEAEINKDIEQANSDIAANLKTIEELSDKIKDAEEASKTLAESVQKVKDKIEQKQEELKTAKPEDKESILNELQGLSSDLASLSSEYKALSENTESLNSQKDEAQEQAEVLSEKKDEVVAEGQQKLDIVAMDAIDLSKQNQQEMAKSIEDKAAAARFGALAAAASSNPITAGEAAQLSRSAADATQASVERQSGAATVSGSIATTANGLNNTGGVIQNFGNGAVGSLSEQSNLIGEAESLLSPIITGAGSYVDSTKQTAENLNSAVSADLEVVQREKENEENDESGNNSSSLSSTSVDTSSLDEIKKPEE